VPDQCEVWLDVHLPPTTSLGEITLELEQLVADARSEDPNLDVTLRFTEVHSGYEIPDRGPMLERLRSMFDLNGLAWTPTPFQSHSDANQLWTSGIKPLLLGPGQLEKAHSADESVSFTQLCQAARLYTDILLQLEGSGV
jgi:acetylornithine deacetylase